MAPGKEAKHDLDLPPLEIFCSYAYKDEPFRYQLEQHLGLLSQQGIATLWHNRRIAPGTNWSQEIDAHLETASLLLLLISSDFLASHYCYGIEMQRALQRHETKEAWVIPILLRSCDWQSAPFALLQILPRGGKPITRWRDRDAAWTEVVTSIRQLLDERPRIDPPIGRLLGPVIWNVPFARNPLFTGREALLNQVRDALSKHTPTMLTQAQAISGLGGIGKTQSAVEYAYRYREMYRYVLWMKATSQDVLLSEFINVARLLRLPERHEQDPLQIMSAVQHWLTTHREWLLIFDNVDDLAMANTFLPYADTGHILLTTQAQAGGSIVHTIEVEKMDVEEGVLLLLRRAKLIGLNKNDEQLIRKHQPVAETIVKELSGLPLALDQAGAYIEETQCSLASYLELYRKRRLDLLRRRGDLPSNHPHSVVATWSLIFQKVEQAHSAAADVLRLCAFFDPDAIPEELLSSGAAELGPNLGPVAADPHLLNEAIAELRKYSLIRRNAEEREVSIHRLVQAVIKEEMTKETQRQWAESAVRVVASSFPLVSTETIQRCRRYYPQAQTCATLINQYNFTFAEAVDLLNQTAFFLQEQAFYIEAELLYKQALHIREDTLGSEHPDTAACLHSLASLYHIQGKYEEAEPLFQQVISFANQQARKQAPSTTASLNNLALLYLSQGKYEDAETLLKRALTIQQHQFGQAHTDTAYFLNNLAILYQDQSRYEEAEALHQRALAIRKTGLGSEHPQTATSLNNLASLYYDQGRYEEAEPLYQRALAIREKGLGPEHPDIAISLGNLSALYHAQGKYEEAELPFQRALAIREKVFGPEHPQTATCLNNLAFLYYDQGRYEEAEPLFQRALTIRAKIFGPEHPQTATCLNNLASLCHAQGKYEEAELLYQRALAIREEIFGSGHPRIANLLKNYAVLLRAMKREDEAAQLENRAQAIKAVHELAAHPISREIESKDLLGVYFDGIMLFYF